MKSNPSKSIRESLEAMIERIQQLRIYLSEPYLPEKILKIKLLSACKGVPGCRLVRKKVSPSVEGVISDFYLSIVTVPPFSATSEAHALLTEHPRFTSQRKSPHSDLKCRGCNKQVCWSK